MVISKACYLASASLLLDPRPCRSLARITSSNGKFSAPETSRHTARSASASREPIRILDRPFGRPLKIPVINQVYFGPLELLEIS
jgi:hypothetical protein